MLGKEIEKSNEYSLISKECIDALNLRINEEEKASRLYHAMAVWFKSKSLNGFATYWKMWSDEELIHASWACTFLQDLDIMPTLKAIPEVKTEYTDVKEVLDVTLKAEMDITEQCNILAKLATEKSNFMLLNLAQEYNEEQQEEINKITNLLSKIETFGTSGIALKELDEDLLEIVNKY